MLLANGNVVHNIKQSKEYCFLMQYILATMYFTFNFMVQKALLKEQLYFTIFLLSRADVLKRLMY